jgi:hypothetical protein
MSRAERHASEAPQMQDPSPIDECGEFEDPVGIASAAPRAARRPGNASLADQ